MFCIDIPAPIYFIFSDSIPQLIYYSHIPTAIVALFIGFFVYLKNRNLLSKILFSITIVFSLWLFFSLITWTNIDSQLIMFFWSLFGILYGLIYILSFYFVYVFIEKKDISFRNKILLLLPFLPIFLFSSTVYNLEGFNFASCEAIEASIYLNYYHFSGVAIFLLILAFSFVKYRKAEKEFKKQILLLAIGIGFFLVSFFTTGYVASLFDNFKLEQYGLFGMTFFMGVLAYMIVKFKAFDIKLIGAQALVVTLIVIIGSQFFFIQNNTNRILTGITLALAVGFGWFLIKSIKTEIQRKEELQTMSDALAEANDQLRKLDNAKSDFISIASHQLRTPLTSIKGFISLLSEGSYGKVTTLQRETLDKVYQSNERLIHLVEDLLDISRIESGRMEFQFAPCQLADLCQEVVDIFSVRAKINKLYLDYKKPSVPLPEITIDAGKVREVISNMVDNALKYTSKGGVSVKMELAESSNCRPLAARNGQDSDDQDSRIKGAVLCLTVADTGIGIPVTELPYLFSKFSRGKDIGRLNAAGTGLGLYVGKSMIEANGGKIWAESEGEGKGSRFIMELPMEQSEEILAKWGK